MMTKIDKVTAETLSLDVEYKPYPGLKYEVGPGIFGSLKPPVMKLHKQVKVLDDKCSETEDDEKVLEIKCEMADLILDRDPGVSVQSQLKEENVYEAVINMAILDFFMVATWRPARHLQSFVPSHVAELAQPLAGE